MDKGNTCVEDKFIFRDIDIFAHENIFLEMWCRAYKQDRDLRTMHWLFLEDWM